MNPAPMFSRHFYRSWRAFTLTELAIVLGIIGVVLGIIWVAAAAVYTNLHISRAQLALLQIAESIRNTYAMSTSTDPNANMTAGSAPQTGGGLTYIQAGIFPSDLLDTGNAGNATTVRTTWGINTDIYIKSAQDTSPNDSFVIVFDNIPLDGCIQLLTGATGQNRDLNMFAAQGDKAGTLPAKIPLPIGASLAASNTGCTTNNASAAFWFRVKT